jgi:hypothetical protein
MVEGVVGAVDGIIVRVQLPDKDKARLMYCPRKYAYA